jgi:valyl-tRNA synthetase
MQRLIERVTALFEGFDYATAKSEIEVFFWTDLADNYLEMAKKRLYDETDAAHEGAKYALFTVLQDTIKLFAPFLPYVTEAIYQGVFAPGDQDASIHRSEWPRVNEALLDETADSAGEVLLEIATAVRRYKSEAGLSLGSEIPRLTLVTADAGLTAELAKAESDIMSVTRALEIVVSERPPGGWQNVEADGNLIVNLG